MPIGTSMPRRGWISMIGIAAVIAARLATAPAAGQVSAGSRGDLGPRENFAVEHEVGQRFRIDPANLPPPGLQASVGNGPRTVAYAKKGLSVPPGFTASLFATGIQNPRRLLV